MADYRDWCGYCHKEINFGSHDPDCDYLHAQRIAAQEQRDFEKALYEEYRNKSSDEVIEEAIALHKELNALESRIHGLGRKWEYIRYVLMDTKAIDEFRERTGRRYI